MTDMVLALISNAAYEKQKNGSATFVTPIKMMGNIFSLIILKCSFLMKRAPKSSEAKINRANTRPTAPIAGAAILMKTKALPHKAESMTM